MVCLQCNFHLSWSQIILRRAATMTEVFVLGFPRSTYVHIVRLVLTHKGVSYTFRDLEPEMGSASHLALHPFDRVPILQHGALQSTKPAQSPRMSMRRSKVQPYSPKTSAHARA